jgi:PKD repeat protein
MVARPQHFLTIKTRNLATSRNKKRLIAMDGEEEKMEDTEAGGMKIRSILYLLIILGISQTLSVSGQSGWDPWCNYPGGSCTANDITITRVYLLQTSPTSVTLMGTFNLNLATDRDCPYSVVDIYQADGQTPIELKRVTWLDTLSGGTSPQEVPLATITYPPGQSIVLKNIYVQWSASKKTCGENCNNYQSAKCYKDPGPLVVPPPLIAAFAGYDVCLGIPIQFTDQTTGGYKPYASSVWNFGDGTTYSCTSASPCNPPAKTYGSAGKYNVTLTVTDDKGVKSTKSQYYYIWAHPVANFSYAQGCGFVVQFTDRSTANTTADVTPAITAWSWDFDGDGSEDSSWQNPEYTFPAPGTYPVKLTVTDSKGCTGFIVKDVTVDPAIQATAASNSPVCEGSTIMLYGGPDGLNSYSWTGPDGFTSSLQNPTISPATLTNAGTYTLKVIDDEGCETEAKTTALVQMKPEVSAGPDLYICETEERVLIEGSNTGGPAAYLWTTSGTGSFEPEGELITHYRPSDEDRESGEVEITLTAVGTGPCGTFSTSDNMTLSILKVPEASINVIF